MTCSPRCLHSRDYQLPGSSSSLLVLVARPQNNKVGTKGRAKNILHDRWWWQRWPALLSFLSPLAPPAVHLAGGAAAAAAAVAAGLLARLLSVARSAVEGATSAICW